MKPPTPLLMPGSKFPLWLAVGHFILRAPVRLERMDLPSFLSRVAAQPRGDADFLRVARIYRRWLRLPGLRSRNTCYFRSLLQFRFMNPQNRDLCLHFGVDETTTSDTRQHGHAWVSLDGVAWNAPGTMAEGRLREIYRFSTLTGGSSTSGAIFAAAMLRDGDLLPVTAPPSSAS
ncbi:MAG: lasso peptide biosynthesis protein [Verrucomicrobiota bacterium]|jgi:hypothetical protein